MLATRRELSSSSAGATVLGCEKFGFGGNCQLSEQSAAIAIKTPFHFHGFRIGSTLHCCYARRALASQWLGADVGSVTSEQRAHAKELAYAMIYGAGSFRLSEALGCTETEAAQLKDSFRLALPGLARWAAGVVEKCAQEGYVETIAGRRRYLPDIRSRDRGKRSRAERQAVNTVCQVMRIPPGCHLFPRRCGA